MLWYARLYRRAATNPARCVDLTKLLIYSFYFIVIVAYYGLPVHIIRDLYMTFRSFVVRINDIIRYRQATADMERRYPSATAQELAAAVDRVCIVCREDMEVGVADPPKKLPCGHLFHLRCLRSWLERQQACPTCRKSVIVPSSPPPAQADYPGLVHRLNTPDNAPRMRLAADQPVVYLRQNNVVPVENRDPGEPQFVLRETLGTEHPVYLEKVRMTGPSPAGSAGPSTPPAGPRHAALDTLEQQLEALAEVQAEIEALLQKARRIQRTVARAQADSNVNTP